MKKFTKIQKQKIRFLFKMKKILKIPFNKFQVIKKINKTVNYFVKKAKQNIKINQILQVINFYRKINNKEYQRAMKNNIDTVREMKINILKN